MAKINLILPARKVGPLVIAKGPNKRWVGVSPCIYITSVLKNRSNPRLVASSPINRTKVNGILGLAFLQLFLDAISRVFITFDFFITHLVWEYFN